MTSVMYIETGLKHSTEKHQIPIVAVASKLRNFFLLAAEYGKENESAVAKRTRKELANAGFSYFQLDRRESHHIANYLQENEHIKAAIHGHVKDVGGVLMVATESRIMYLHDIPLFSNFEEFPYDIVSGVSINNVSHILSSVRLFTKFKTYELDYVNIKSAEKFVRYVESRIYSQNNISLIHKRERGLSMKQRQSIT